MSGFSTDDKDGLDEALTIIEHMVNYPTVYYKDHPRFRELIDEVANHYLMEYASSVNPEIEDSLKVVVTTIMDYPAYMGRKVMLDSKRATLFDDSFDKKKLKGKNKGAIDDYVAENWVRIKENMDKMKALGEVIPVCGGYRVLCPYEKE